MTTMPPVTPLPHPLPDYADPSMPIETRIAAAEAAARDGDTTAQRWTLHLKAELVKDMAIRGQSHSSFHPTPPQPVQDPRRAALSAIPDSQQGSGVALILRYGSGQAAAQHAADNPTPPPSSYDRTTIGTFDASQAPALKAIDNGAGAGAGDIGGRMRTAAEAAWALPPHGTTEWADLPPVPPDPAA